jgi:hypothetical protein
MGTKPMRGLIICKEKLSLGDIKWKISAASETLAGENRSEKFNII